MRTRTFFGALLLFIAAMSPMLFQAIYYALSGLTGHDYGFTCAWSCIFAIILFAVWGLSLLGIDIDPHHKP